MSTEFIHPELPYVISTDFAAFDMVLVHNWLSVDAYWSTDIPFDTIERGFKNSLAFGMFRQSGEQVGVARMITDRATFAYLADVFIIPEERGQGLAKWLMEVIMGHPELKGLRRLMLATRDMHPLYRQFGFKNVEGHDLLMEISIKDAYQKKPKPDGEQ